jgi:signal transduction histidine kinase
MTQGPGPGTGNAESLRLAEENALLKRELEDVRWAAEKTNQGVKHLYRELERQNGELKKLDSLKSEFISTVSHELRTPLAVIREAVAQIADGVHGPVGAGQAQTLGLALKGADRLTRLVTDLLDLSKIESGKFRLKLEPSDLALCARDAAQNLLPAARRKKLELTVDAPGALVTYADRDKVDQILTNLISNAVKFTEAGSVKVTVAAADDHARITVEDTGIGIAEADLSRVFSKFEQFSRQRSTGEKGAGLGLAICKGLAEMHGGAISVESRLGAGSRFTVRIPLRDARAAAEDLWQRLKERSAARGAFASMLEVRFEGPEAGKASAGIEPAVRDCLRRQEDVLIAGDGRCWILLPDTDRAAASAVKDRVRERVDAFLKKGTDGRCQAEYALTVGDPETGGRRP